MVVTVDTLRPDHLHCYGYPNIETPALDGLARRGVLFENAVAQTPLTPPSHASIFTGQNPNVHKVRNTGGFVLQSSSHPLARILQEQGWDTAAFIGSAVLKKLFGFNNGFSVYDDEMPRPGKRNEFREDPERKASVPIVTILVAKLIRPSAPFLTKLEAYECGIKAASDSRGRYTVRFYIVAILFVIFDVETIFLFPWAVRYRL